MCLVDGGNIVCGIYRHQWFEVDSDIFYSPSGPRSLTYCHIRTTLERSGGGPSLFPRAHYVAQAGLELVTILPSQPSSSGILRHHTQHESGFLERRFVSLPRN